MSGERNVTDHSAVILVLDTRISKRVSHSYYVLFKRSQMDIILIPFLRLMIQAISLYKFMLFIYIILGWLENFNIINRYNQLVYGIHNFLFKIIEPVLTPIRRIMPNFGGLDLSALVLIFGLHFIQDILVQIIMKFPS